MIRKSGNRFSEKIMLKQRDEIMIRSNWIMIQPHAASVFSISLIQYDVPKTIASSLKS
jgi:hypothetical protein